MKNDKNFKIKLVLLWVFAFSVIIFMMSLTANAEEPYFPMGQNDNGNIPQDLMDYLETYLDSENNFIFIAPWGDGYYWYAYVPKGNGDINTFGEINNNGYQFRLYTTSSIAYGGYIWWVNGESWGVWDTGFQAINNGNPFNSSLYDTSMSYVSNFRIYTNNTENADVVLNYGSSDPIISVGTAVLPPTAFIPEYLTGDTPPQNVPPEYTVTDYTWTTSPQFDSSTVINGIQSIKNTLEWLSSNLHEELANLIDNIKGLATYIGKTIQYYGNAIIETINNAIQNFYDNMKALVEPIYTTLENLYNGFLEFADLFIHPFDEEEFQDQIENCQLISQYNELMDNADDIRAIFNNAEERDYFVLYIDFENPFADSEHKIIHSEISFTWLKNYRSTYRPFLWVFTMIECFVGGMRLLGGIIGGKAK